MIGGTSGSGFNAIEQYNRDGFEERGFRWGENAFATATGALEAVAGARANVRGQIVLAAGNSAQNKLFRHFVYGDEISTSSVGMAALGGLASANAGKARPYFRLGRPGGNYVYNQAWKYSNHRLSGTQIGNGIDFVGDVGASVLSNSISSIDVSKPKQK